MNERLKKLIPSRRDLIMTAVMIISSAIICFIDLAPQSDPPAGTKEKALVLSTDDSGIIKMGPNLYRGSQRLEVEILSGKHKGKKFTANNELRTQMDLDKIFSKDDIILVGILHGADPETDMINAQDHYRITNTLYLFGLFAVLLLCFGGYTGFGALLSFVFSCLVIWKIVIPLTLAGGNPILISFGAVVVLSVVIIFLVAGLTRKGIAALSGSLLGVFASLLTGWIFTLLFRINGAIMPYSQALIFSGYENLNLSEIYIGAIFLSSSGAVMDLAMDISSGIEEVSMRNRDLSFKELFKSGIRMGRSVVGTMTTTLLLAYSGGYLTLMMVFTAQGTSPVDFINNPHVASETVKTLVGSFGLVLVAPFTAAIGALIFKKTKKEITYVSNDK